MPRSRGASVTTIVALALAGAGVTLALAPGDEASHGPEAVAARLVREFRGSYPLEARPGGKVVDIEIVAAPVELEMLDGRRLAVWAYNGTLDWNVKPPAGREPSTLPSAVLMFYEASWLCAP